MALAPGRVGFRWESLWGANAKQALRATSVYNPLEARTERPETYKLSRPEREGEFGRQGPEQEDRRTKPQSGSLLSSV